MTDSESHPESISWTWRFIRNIISSLSFTSSIDKVNQNKKNVYCLIDTRIIHTQMTCKICKTNILLKQDEPCHAKPITCQSVPLEQPDKNIH